MATEPLHMDRTDTYRPRISRETRLLLTTALIATVALWVLARVRFPDRPPPTNPVQPLLTQLTPRPTFADLAAEISVLRPRLVPLLVAVEPDKAGLRVTDDIAVVWLNPRQPLAERDADSLAGYDPVSGLALMRVESRATPPAMLWSPQSLGPRYFVASEISSAGISLRPTYVASLGPTDNPRWPGQEWQVPSGANIAPGSFLFTAEAEIAGLVIDQGDGLALVPAETLFAEAARLSGQPRATRGYVGIDVQPLTPALSKATGAARGVVVAWVDPRGPGADGLNVGDVIESGNKTGVPTPDHWDALIARLTTGETLAMSVRGVSGARDVSLMVAEPRAADPASLGLTLRSVPGVGVEVVRIERGSSGDRSGLAQGDVITRVDGTDVPTPAQLQRAFVAARDRALIVAFTRGTSRRVTALEK